MIFSLAPTFVAILFGIIILSVYFRKSIIKNSKTLMFKVVLLDSFLFGFTEIFPMYLLLKGAGEDLISYVWKCHWIFGYFWFFSIVVYFRTIIHNIDEGNNIFKVLGHDIFNKLLTGLYLVIQIGAFTFFPKAIFDINNLDFIPGSTHIFMLVLIGLIFIGISISLSKNKKYVTKEEAFGIVTSLLLTIIILFIQVEFKYISILPIGFIIFVYSLYLNVENPELEILKETNYARSDIEKSNKIKTEFLSNTANEIKEPISIIDGLCNELKNISEYNEGEVKEKLGKITSSGNNLLEVVNNILDISKIESGNDTIQEKEYKIMDMLKNLINITKSKLNNSPVELVIDIDKNISSVLYGDSAKIYQTLLNILDNAIHYTDVGKIKLSVKSVKNENDEDLIFKISDTGIGIKEEDYDKVFTGQTIDGNENGLGLQIAKKYIESLGGKIWFDSQYQVGTTFHIEINQKIINREPSDFTYEDEVETTSMGTIDCSAYTILIVDNNDLNIQVGKRLLSKYKFNIESVKTGQDCIYQIKAGKKYDLIFMDIMMPGLSGSETLNKLNKLDGYIIPPTIAITADSISEISDMYINDGFADYLSKPINRRELERVINKFFNKQKTE